MPAMSAPQGCSEERGRGETHLEAHYYSAISVSHQRSLAHPRPPFRSKAQQHHSSLEQMDHATS